MRIMITNDDGINAPGLKVLHAIATELAGSDGEVWTVAPAFEQSGVGHCINYTKPTMVSSMDEKSFAVEGSPADCVLAGLHHIMKDAPPDLILSGVNKGNNSAENTVYSGTIGAAMEAALQGFKAIALSQYYGPANVNSDDPFEASGKHGAAVVRSLLEKGIWGGEPYSIFYNVNFPPVPASDVKGTAIVKQGKRPAGQFGVKNFTAPNFRDYLWVSGSPQNVGSGDESDATANLDGYISVTPMTCDLTNYDALAELRKRIG